MKCFECREPAEHLHHVVPRSASGTQTVPLCLACHEKVHDRKLSSRAMIKQGLADARARGQKLGAPIKLDAWTVACILGMRAEGLTIKAIAKKVGLSVGTVHKAIAGK